MDLVRERCANEVCLMSSVFVLVVRGDVGSLEMRQSDEMRTQDTKERTSDSGNHYQFLEYAEAVNLDGNDRYPLSTMLMHICVAWLVFGSPPTRFFYEDVGVGLELQGSIASKRRCR